MASHDLGDMEVLRANLEAWMRQHVAGAEALTLDALDFPQESGESSVSLIVTGHAGGEAHRYLCRMKPPQSQIFNEHDLLMQYELMRIAGSEGVPVPPLHGYEADESLLGSDFYIMGFVDGLVPADNPPFAFTGWVKDLSDAQRTTMWSNGLTQLARIHQIDINAHDFSRLPTAAPDASPVQHELDKYCGLMSDEEIAQLPDFFAQSLQYLQDNAPMGAQRRLCWGDSRMGNVMWQGQEVVAILDWEMASIGDPVQDVSWWYWVDCINSVGLGVPRLGGLPSLGEIYEQWHRLTGLPLGDTDYHDLFSVVRFSIIMERKLASMAEAGMEAIPNYTLPFVEERLKVCLAGR